MRTRTEGVKQDSDVVYRNVTAYIFIIYEIFGQPLYFTETSLLFEFLITFRRFVIRQCLSMEIQHLCYLLVVKVQKLSTLLPHSPQLKRYPL